MDYQLELKRFTDIVNIINSNLKEVNANSRCFDKQIFFGNEFCFIDIVKLFARINYGITLLSGLQQPLHSYSNEESEQEEKQYTKDILELKNVVLDVVVAFGFNDNIELKEK